jgi:hypothetical protein
LDQEFFDVSHLYAWTA